MQEMTPFCVALLLFVADLPTDPSALLARVAEEAELLGQKAPNALAEETLEQRAHIVAGGRIRVGAAARKSPLERLQVREIVSEYTVGRLKGSESSDLVEFRQVIAVDGHPVQSADNARHALSLGVLSADDRARKRMLEDFARHGLVDVASDYAMALLAFTGRGQQQLRIEPIGEDRIGSDDAMVFSWAQTTARGGELVFAGRQTTRQPLQGKLWVRMSDGLPLRIWLWAAYKTARDEATIDYAMSPHGFLTPASVRHRHIVEDRVTTENLYRYGPFRLFGADANIRFAPLEPPASQPTPQPAK
jgi:hypothetical protein